MERHILPPLAVLWVVSFIGVFHSCSYAQQPHLSDPKLVEKLSHIETVIQNNDRHIERLQTNLNTFMWAVFGGFLGIVGLILWDRRTMGDKIIAQANHTMNDTVGTATAKVTAEVTANLSLHLANQIFEVKHQIQELKDNIDTKINETNNLLHEARSDVQRHILQVEADINRIEEKVDYHERIIRRDYNERR